MYFKLIVIFAFLYPIKVQGSFSNSCSDWLSYLFPPLSPSCFYNPDVFANTIEIIERHLGKGSYENYTVTTEDGYILTLFRILQNNPKGVVMLQHPVTSDGVVWVQDSKKRSMAFNLHDMGYEVWLPNHRGTYYSEKHVNLSINGLKYWQFGFHEIAVYDYPAFAEKISEVSKSTDIIFVGHSMSSTSGVVYQSMQPEHAKKYFKGMILMSPVVFLHNLRGIATLIAPIFPLFSDVAYFFGVGGLFNKGSISEILARSATYAPIKQLLIMIQSLGSGPGQFDPKLSTFFFSHFPRGISFNTVNHYSQIYNAGGEFRMYDYGSKENFKRYKSKTPPSYPLENIRVPIHLVASQNDYLATVEDNDILLSRLSEPGQMYGKFYTTGLNHIDFFYGKHRYELAINHVLEFIDKM
ncbi:unnamed protein product [Brassicogethes aeneus]|uniref:Lipase n=1 Tax=Brassicogethes aeneus TaxID=1431903 RepID=A0A9P0AVA3_BRAAE|nr:unnamed protein product [Brassicogethes aeneus]